MARRRRPETDVGEDHDTVVAWYRERLAKPAAFPWKGLRWEPVRIGPTWQTRRGRWVLPEATIGWDVLGWCGTELQRRPGQPWRFTLEQARFLLWWYSVEPDGSWTFDDGVLQRLKGWGKDPVAACLLYNEMLGPCRVAFMDGDEPVATDCTEAWAQSVATSLDQTKNTMRLMPGLITPAARRFYRVQVGKTLIHAQGDTRLIEAVTSSPTTVEGARSTFVERNETHLWFENNDGHDMAAVIERNNTKSEDGGARSLAITNAFEPGQDSSAQRDREAYETAAASKSLTTGILYDSLEAAPEAPLALERRRRETDEAHKQRVHDTVSSVVAAVRGDSTWLSQRRIVRSVLDTRNPPSQSRRWWYNQIIAAEDAWVAPQEWDAGATPVHVVDLGALITIGFDGSFSDDHSALIGCEVATDHLFEIEVWRPSEATGQVDRAAIDRTVRATFENYDVVGFYSDLHPYESYVDTWANDLGSGLCAKASPRQAVAWDIRGRAKDFTAATERLHAAIVESSAELVKAGQERRDPRQRLTHCGSAAFRQHVHNARRAPNRFGVTVRKESRESDRKIDSVPAAVLARLARLDYLALPKNRQRQRRRSGRVWT